jgi:hypothetical protein
MKTAKKLREEALHWDEVEKKWQNKLAENPNDRMTQLSSDAVQRIARQAAAERRAKAASKIGRKQT